MYGRLLSMYSTAAVSKLGIESIVRNYHSWFREWFQTTYDRQAPKVDAYQFDWAECFKIIVDNPPPPKLRPHLIIDEGQDFPRELFAILKLISTSMTVFADENQQLTDDRSTISEILSATGIVKTAHLSQNFRNTRAIAAFSGAFYTGAGSAPVQLRDNASDGDLPVLDRDSKLHDTILRIANYEKAHPGELIGVLLPYNDLLKRFYNRLDGKTKSPVEIYLSTDMQKRRPIHFGKPGVKLICYPSAKGLEFDTVFLPELQANKMDPRSVLFRMNFYVMTSRAKSSLYLIYSGDGEPAVTSTLDLKLMSDWRK
jgi:DNA helicase IV